MQPDPAVAAETRSWLLKASKDLAAGAHDMVAHPPLADDAVFHAQQAAEKALKAFLTWQGQTHRKTHNLIELGEACSQLDASLLILLRRAAPLTEYAWKFRYPGEPEEPSRQEAEEALTTARAVYEAIVARVPTSARP